MPNWQEVLLAALYTALLPLRNWQEVLLRKILADSSSKKQMRRPCRTLLSAIASS